MRSLRMVEITQQEKYGFNDCAINAILDGWNSVFKACWIYHNKDPDTLPHYHLYIKFKSPVPFDNIVKHSVGVLQKHGCEYVTIGNDKFPMLPVQQFQMIKSRWSSCIAYLTHANAPDKHQYKLDEVKTFNMSLEELEDETKQGSNTSKVFTLLLDGIKSGKIREYNLFDYVDIEDYIKLKRKIEYAFNWKMNCLITERKDRDMKVFYITGRSGVGKTVSAKFLCGARGWSYCISSSSNDPLQDYRGEDCLILDDIRPDTWEYSDFLKLLDNHTSSSVRSRYSNKYMCYCKCIMITSTLNYLQFYKRFLNSSGEDFRQFERRLTYRVEITPEDIIVVGNDGARARMDNPVLLFEHDKEVQKSKQMEDLSAFGFKFT